MKALYLFLCSFMAFCGVNAQQEKPFDITFKIKGIQNETAILGFYYGDKKLIADSIKFDENGIGKIQGNKEKLTNGIYLVVFPSLKYKYFDFVMKEKVYTIMGDTANFDKLESKGSIENEVFFKDTKVLGNFQKQLLDAKNSLDSVAKIDTSKVVPWKNKIKAIQEQQEKHRAATIAKYPNLFYTKVIKMIHEPKIEKPLKRADGTYDSLYPLLKARKDFLADIDFSDSCIIKTPVFYGKIFSYINNYYSPEPDSIKVACDQLIGQAKSSSIYQFLCVELLNKYASSGIMGHDAVYVHLAEKYYLPQKATWSDSATLAKIQESVFYLKPTLIGSYAPRITGLNKDSTKAVVIDSIIFKHDFTIIAFWDPNCSHCKTEMPLLTNLWRDTLQYQNIGLVGVCIDRDKEKMNEFIIKQGISDLKYQLYDPTGKAIWRSFYDLRVTPLVIIVDRKGKIVAKRIDAKDINWYLKNWKESH